MRPHNLRKFFRLRVGRYGRDEAEAMMGHQTGLNAIYARFDDAEERLEEVYKKAIEDLSIYKRTVQIVQVDEDTKNKLRELEDQLDAVVNAGRVKTAEINHLSKKIDSLTEELDQRKELDVIVKILAKLLVESKFRDEVRSDFLSELDKLSESRLKKILNSISSL